jgi:hypothetical protein
MDTTGDEVQNALSLIEDAGLPHPSGPLLASFITEALSPPLAARYVKRRSMQGQGPSLVANWSYIIESSKLIFALDPLTFPFICRPPP